MEWTHLKLVHWFYFSSKEVFCDTKCIGGPGKYNCQTHPWKIHHIFLWAFMPNDPTNKGHEQTKKVLDHLLAMGMILKLVLLPLFSAAVLLIRRSLTLKSQVELLGLKGLISNIMQEKVH